MEDASSSGGGRKRGRPSAPTDNEQDDARKREQRAQVIARVEGMDAAGALDALDALAQRWMLDAPGVPFDSLVAHIFANFGSDVAGDVQLGDRGSYGIRQIDDAVHQAETEAIVLYHKLRYLKVLSDPVALARIVGVLEQIYYGKRMVLSVLQAKLAIHQVNHGVPTDLDLHDDVDARLGSWSLRFRWADLESTNQMQKLLLHLLDAAMEKRYRKYNGYVFEPIIVNGYNTHAWRQVQEIKDFVYGQCSKELQWQEWCYLTHSANNAKNAVEYLSSCTDFQFPELKKNRHVFSFRNGVYVTKTDTFYTFGVSEPLADHVTACKFYDCDCEAFEGVRWQDIPTPSLDSILEYQEFPEDVRRWAFVFIGRLLYELGEMDSWQVIPFFLGAASSGKSTIVLKVCKALFDAIDVAVLSNNVEKKFGISAMYDKYIFVAPEVRNDIALDQAEFQSIVSGEDVQIAVKHQKAFSTQWRVPGVLAGNEVPSWADASGSIQRRLVVFDFHKPVTHGDMRLADKLARELPKVLVKANRAYLEAVASHSNDNIWTVLGPYFMSTRDAMAQSVNALEAFLASSEVALGEHLYCPFDDFKAALKVFESSNGYRPSKFTWQFFRTPLSKFGISKVKEALEYQGRTLKRDYLKGVDLDQTGGGGSGGVNAGEM